MKKFTLLLLLSLMVVPMISMAQDVHFSQFYAAPMILNPALTADGSQDMRIGVNYRNQWPAIKSTYRTQSAWLDAKINPAFLSKKDWMGIGGYFYNDKAGVGDLSDTKAVFATSYNKGLNRRNTLYFSVGASVGIGNRSVDYTKLLFASQWSADSGFDPNNPSNEPYRTSSFFYVDFNGGVQLSYQYKKQYRIYGGSSLSHINRPRSSFYEQQSRIEMKNMSHVGMEIYLKKGITLMPQVMYTTQKGNEEMVLGANMKIDSDGASPWFGIWSRLGRDVILAGGVEFDQWRILFSYDINHSKLYNHKALEFSVVKSINFPWNKSVCPLVDF